MRAIVLIPARLASKRVPNKALLPIAGKPLIAHVVERGLEAGLGPVHVATDSEEIAAIARAFGVGATLTRREHACGSDRLGEALAAIDPDGRYEAIVNLQGDLPFLPSGALAASLSLLEDARVDIGTLATLASPEEETSPDAPKIVGTLVAPQRLRAHYFSRARVPFGEGPTYRHLGVYAFRRGALQRYVSLPVSTLEAREGLEQLRALEDGMRIDAALLDKAPVSVDTLDDLGALRAAAIDSGDKS
ncbi:3-deoxy-manno-octulosonate cytidylyltransferase [Methylocystis bryophila]|uniref:3-deoxy-manno-octulosonate cytidylyltransferase n=1 Tax=Methylocystis bryophila TaxID=655015 RepID=UPI000C9D9A61|nr:3-deoxy-manno-octulosonate cytidylyltransferase [Methylocystis bryophila]BDV40228.1 3-deoxy-manno-octulosonate cytidylyltransferase [Methylocystis bryophila]